MESTDSHAGIRPPIQVETIDETIPLLGGDDATPAEINKFIKRQTFLITAAAIVIIDLAMWLGIAPQAQIFEDIICRQYYEHAANDPTKILLPIASYDCKVPSVQNELAFITGWQDTLFSIPSKFRERSVAFTLTYVSTAIFLTVPYGALSDRTSRKLVVVLACVGLLIADGLTKVIVAFPDVFPLRLIWATPIFLVIGGGGGVAGSLVYAILADVFPPAER